VTRLAIVIVSFNARDDLTRALASLRDAPPRTSHTIIVVDNGSTDGAPDRVRSEFPDVRLLDAGGNLGFGRANNRGIRESAGDHVLLLNPDTVVPAGAVDALVAPARGSSTDRAAPSCRSARCTRPGPKGGGNSRWRSMPVVSGQFADGSRGPRARRASRTG
jgi:GT2 family glycosyltransferase